MPLGSTCALERTSVSDFVLRTPGVHLGRVVRVLTVPTFQPSQSQFKPRISGHVSQEHERICQVSLDKAAITESCTKLFDKHTHTHSRETTLGVWGLFLTCLKIKINQQNVTNGQHISDIKNIKLFPVREKGASQILTPLRKLPQKKKGASVLTVERSHPKRLSAYVCFSYLSILSWCVKRFS